MRYLPELLRVTLAQTELLLWINIINIAEVVSFDRGGLLALLRLHHGGPLLYTLDQTCVLVHDPHVVVVDVPAWIAVLIVLVTVLQVVMHLALVSMSFNLASIVKDMNAVNHVRCTIVAISAH